MRRLAITAALTTLLAACGGGGGGSEQPPVAPPPPVQPAPPPPAPAPPPPAPTPPPGPTGSIDEAEGCAAPAGSAACEGRARITIANVEGATLEVGLGGAVAKIAVARSGDVRFALPGAPTEHPLRLVAGTQVLDGTKKVAKTCATGTDWDQGVTNTCHPLVSYQNLVAARHAFGLFSRLTVERGIELPANKTGYDTPQWVIDNGGSRFGRCGLLRDPQGENGVKKDAFGRLEGACTDAVDLVIRPVRISLTENAMYSGGTHTIPVAEAENDVNYISSCESTGPQPFADWGRWLELSTGWFFIYNRFMEQFPIYWQPKGDPLPAPVMVEPESPFQWNLSCLRKFSFTASGQ